jgi:Uma2 family endonuclease
MAGMTIEEFIRAYKKEAPFELVDGEIRPLKPMVVGHATVLKNIYDPLSQHVNAHGLGEIYYRLPYVITDANGLVVNSRTPDLMFISKERFEKYKTEHEDWEDQPILIVPDMVVEIQDHYEEFYETDHKVKRDFRDGVQEIWWVNIDFTAISLGHASNYVLVKLDDTVASKLISGFSIPVKTIFQEHLHAREAIRQQVVKQIEEAFANTPHPGNKRIGVYGYSIDYDLLGKHWKEIPLDIIVKQRGELSFLTLEAYRYYIPAFMTATLLHYEEVDTLAGNLISHFSPPAEESGLTDYFLRKNAGFNRGEQKAILTFLESYLLLHPTEYPTDDTVYRPMLDRGIEYWKNRLKAEEL